jgi:membrane-associated phospholipid phosphatase
MDPVRPRRARPPWYLEVALLGGGYLVFGLLRAAIDRGDPAATDNAVLVQRAERVLGLAVEHPLNQAVLAHPAALYVSGYFYRLCLLAVPAVLVWLHVSRPEHYRRLRTVLVVVTLLDLPLVWLFPESPPRFALAGVVDYIATHDILFGAGSRTSGSGLNLLAAMPSMHVAWTTWCAYAVWTALRPSRPRGAWLAWLLPLLTALDVLVTGHHYVLDVLGGVALVAIVVRVTGWVARRRGLSGVGPGRDEVRRR